MSSASDRQPEQRRTRTVRGLPVVLLASLSVVLSGCVGSSPDELGDERTTGTTATVAPTVTGAGGRLTYAGVVPWRGAVRPSAGSTELTVSADGDLVHGKVPVCDGTDAQTVHVEETPRRVAIRVDGWADPQRLRRTTCSGVGHLPVPHTIHLHRPLGARPVIDLSDDQTHAVLSQATVPRLERVPRGFVDGGAHWDDRVPEVDRSYTEGPAEPRAEGLDLDIGPDRDAAPLEHPYWTPAPGTRIHGIPASVWRHRDVYTVNTLVIWHRGLQTYRLTSFGTPRHHLTEQQVVRSARSIGSSTPDVLGP